MLVPSSLNAAYKSQNAGRAVASLLAGHDPENYRPCLYIISMLLLCMFVFNWPPYKAHIILKLSSRLTLLKELYGLKKKKIYICMH